MTPSSVPTNSVRHFVSAEEELDDGDDDDDEDDG